MEEKDLEFFGYLLTQWLEELLKLELIEEGKNK
jgi:hypothetical protein